MELTDIACAELNNRFAMVAQENINNKLCDALRELGMDAANAAGKLHGFNDALLDWLRNAS